MSAEAAAGLPPGAPSEVAAGLGITIVADPGPARFGPTLLLACWEPDRRTIRIWEQGVTEEAARRGEPVELVRLEALAHEVLHALETAGTETEIRRLAREWATRPR